MNAYSYSLITRHKGVYTLKRLLSYYNGYNEEQRTQRSRVHQIEFLTNVEMIGRYLPEDSKILDVGAGTGVYSFNYAEQGHHVHAIDIVPKHVEEMRKKQEELVCATDLTIDIGDALDLSRYEDGLFDAVICFGPIYHLRDIEDRKTCLSECIRVLKPNGILSVAYLNTNFIVPFSYKLRGALTEKELEQLFESGNVLDRAEEDFLSFSHFDTPKRIEELISEFPVEQLIHAGSEGMAHFISEQINELSDADYNKWLSYHFKTCTDSNILGISNHGIIVVRKK